MFGDFNLKQAAANILSRVTGDVTFSFPGLAASLATVNSNVGSFTYASVTVNGKGLITAASSGAAPATGLVPLVTVNASGAASVAFSSTYITSTYNKYVIEFDGVYGSAASHIALTVSTNNGSTYLSTGYYWTGQYQQTGGSANDASSNTNASIDLSMNGAAPLATSASYPTTGTIKFANPSVSAQCNFSWDANYGNATAANMIYTEGWGNSGGTTAINNIKIVPSSGTITGNFHLYGIAGT